MPRAFNSAKPIGSMLLLFAFSGGCQHLDANSPDSGQESDTDAACDDPLSFADPDLELAVRDAIGKALGPICPEDVADLNVLDAHNFSYDDHKIGNLSGIEHLIALEDLDILGNDVTDLSPLGSLGSLQDLCATNNPISDLQPISGLTSLTVLYLHNCEIDDISPLSSLVQLQLLSLGYNHVSDLAPLVANPGMGEGDTVYLEEDPIDTDAQAANIEALEARGVTLVFDVFL